MKRHIRIRRPALGIFLVVVFGAALVVFAATLPDVIDFDTSTASSHQDVTIYGGEAYDNLGAANNGGSSSCAADVNGDGVKDIIVAASFADGPRNARTDCGEVYVFFGPASAGVRDVAGIAGRAPDVTIYGATSGDTLGRLGIVSGDVNGDRIADIIIVADRADGPAEGRRDAGEVYVIYGSASLPSEVDLDTSQPGNHQNVTIYGATAGDSLNSLAVADLNGDGICDIIAGARLADGPGEARTDSGEVYIICGAATLPSTIDLDTTQAGAHQNTTIYGEKAYHYLTGSVTLNTGDFNGDGITDLAFGSASAGINYNGAVYLVFGSSILPASIDLDKTQPGSHQDMTIYGASGDAVGASNAFRFSDVNGDGIEDIIVGACYGDGPEEARSDCGEAYVIYGAVTPPSVIDLDTSTPEHHQDVTIYGALANDFLTRLSGIATGDINGDGIGDILLGAPWSSGYAGTGYAIYGSKNFPATIDLLTTDADVTIKGAQHYDYMPVSGSLRTGDFNGDGLADIMLGAYGADGPAEARESCGEAYLVYGATQLPRSIDISTSGEDVTVYGATSYDQLTYAALFLAADVSGDGFDDFIVGSYCADGPGEGRHDAGELYDIFGKGEATSSTVKMIDHAGNPLAKDYGTARCSVDYGSGAAVSTTTVTMTRNDTGVNMPDLSKVADVNWTISTDRTAFSAKVVFHYLDSEIAGLTEANLKLYKAATIGGDYSEVTGAVLDTALNTVTATGLTGFSTFILSTSPPSSTVPKCFVESVRGSSGNRAMPFVFTALALAGALGVVVRKRR